MKTEKIIKEIEETVETACQQETNQFGYGIWSHHITVVVDYAEKLANRLSADEKIVKIAALLHDYAGIKDIEYHDDHHLYGAQEAEHILENLGYPEEKIDQVNQCILTHRASKGPTPDSTAEVCLASADAMAHIDQVVSLLHMVYSEQDLDIDAGKEWVRNKIKRSWNKLNQEAKEMIEDKYQAALIVLE